MNAQILHKFCMELGSKEAISSERERDRKWLIAAQIRGIFLWKIENVLLAHTQIVYMRVCKAYEN